MKKVIKQSGSFHLVLDSWEKQKQQAAEAHSTDLLVLKEKGVTTEQIAYILEHLMVRIAALE